LNQLLKTKKILADTSNFYEQIDDQINRQLCLQCGGKGYYIEIFADPETRKPYKVEKVSCEVCESGFIYGNKAS